MSNEEKITAALTQKFSFLEGKCNITRARRVWVDVDRNHIIEMLDFAKNELGFNLLCTITGLDVAENLEFIYHIANKEGIVINVRTNAPKSDPVIKTVLGVYQGATYYERELEDLLGAKVDGLPEGRHYPLPEDWPKGQHPLRKDWKRENLTQKIKTEE